MGSRPRMVVGPGRRPTGRSATSSADAIEARSRPRAARRSTATSPTNGSRRSPRSGRRRADRSRRRRGAATATRSRRSGRSSGRFGSPISTTPTSSNLRDELLASGLSAQTVASVMKTLGQALKRATIKGYLGQIHDADVVARPVGRPRKVPPITAERAQALLASSAASGRGDAAAISRSGSRSGARRRSASDGRHVDFDGGESSASSGRSRTAGAGSTAEDPKIEAGRRE